MGGREDVGKVFSLGRRVVSVGGGVGFGRGSGRWRMMGGKAGDLAGKGWLFWRDERWSWRNRGKRNRGGDG